eukprot:5799866-Amphidinium_carterae.1
MKQQQRFEPTSSRSLTALKEVSSGDSSYDSAESHSGNSAGPSEAGGSSPSVPRDPGCPTD